MQKTLHKSIQNLARQLFALCFVLTCIHVFGEITATEIIVDNQDANTSQVGTWTTSSAPSPYNGNSVYSDGNGTFRWLPTMAGPGKYDLYAWWTYHNNRSSTVPYNISHTGGLESVIVDQNDAGLAGQWILLGCYDFSAGSYVEVSSENGQASADAIRLVASSTPFINVTGPSNGDSFTFGDTITFTASATDLEDGDISGSIQWSSDQDGAFGSTGTFVTSTLSVGTHIITASITDSEGLTSAATITLTINQVGQNQTPLVTITAPVDGSSFNQGDTVTFTGNATDTEDGDITSGLLWTSSQDGQIGSTGSFNTSTLSVGTHVITANVSDSGSSTGTHTITLTVNSVGGGSASTVFSDDFESDLGWVINPAGTNTATKGIWERGQPEESIVSGELMQLGNTVSGTYGLITGPLTSNLHDVDKGVTSIASPPIILPTLNAGESLQLTFWHYFAHRTSSDTADYLRVTVQGESGNSQVLYEQQAGNGEVTTAAWAQFTGILDNFAGQTVTLLFSAADEANASTIEAAIDDVLIQNLTSSGGQIAVDDSVTTTQATPITVDVLANDSDPDRFPLAVTAVTHGNHGAVTLEDNEVVYTPNISFVGTDTFFYRISNGQDGAATAAVTVTITADATILFSDDFESDLGWRVNPTEADTATAGQWERGQPKTTTAGGSIMQLGTTISGTYGLITGPLTSNLHDVDRGVTSIASPPIILPTLNASESLQLTFWHYFAHRPNGDTADYLRVTVQGESGNQVLYEQQAGNGEETTAAWTQFTGILDSFAGQTVTLLFSAADEANASTIEAAIDDIKVQKLGTGDNTAPTASITAPANGSSFNEGDTVTFTGNANDTEDDDITNGLQWSSSLDGLIGSTGSFSTSTLSVGSHTITASITDSGALTGTATITVTINPIVPNQIPVVTITAPANASVFNEGDTISFTGTASDTEDGDITNGMLWSSSLDGSIGTTGAFSTSTLSAGTHLITARITDSGGLKGTATIMVFSENVESDLSGAYSDNDPPLVPGQAYIVGGLTVLAGETLTIPAGVTLKFVKDSLFIVNGTLNIQGQPGSEVILTSAEPVPAIYDWGGMVVEAGSTVTVDHAVFEYANTGIKFNDSGAAGTITNSTFRYNWFGIYAYWGAAPNLSSGNVITLNNYGVYALGRNTLDYPDDRPNPTVTNGAIYDNIDYNYFNYVIYDNANFVLNARNNWWGTADPAQISASIYGYGHETDYVTHVDYSGYLDAENGSPNATTLVGAYSDNDAALVSGQTYLLGNLTVLSGDTLTIPAGVTLRFLKHSGFSVNGTLNIQGQSGNEVILTSAEPVPGIDDWYQYWTGMVVEAGSTVTVDYAVFEYAEAGIKFNDSATTGTITNSTFRYNWYGVYAYYGAAPNLTSGNVMTANLYGVYALGSSTSANPEYRPNPAVNNAAIYDNTYYNYYTSRIYDNANFVLNAQNNWWGTTDPALITDSIYGYEDNISSATHVDYSGYLDAENGSPITTTLVGPYSDDDAPLVSGQTYLVGDLTVLSGETLTIPPRVTLQFVKDSFLTVNGTLNIQGQPGSEVIFTSAESLPAKEDWGGLVVEAGSTVTVDHAVFEYAEYGIRFNDSGAAGTITNSTFRYNKYGVYISGAAPNLSNGNVFTANDYGVYVSGLSSNPTVTNDAIYGNTTYNYYASKGYGNTNFVLNARNNWWGTTDPALISASIYSYEDNIRFGAHVDYSGYLNAENGNPDTTTLVGAYSDINPPFVSGQTYLVGSLTVLSGDTLTVPAGVTLEFVKGSRFSVNGTLNIQGQPGSEVILTSAEALPAKEDWGGLVVEPGSTLTVDHAVFEYAESGIRFNDSDAAGTITNSTFRYNKYGVYVYYGAAPSLSSNVITLNDYGVYALGRSSSNYPDDRPNPTVINGAIYDNSLYNYYTSRIYDNANFVLNARNNWWGTTDPALIRASIYGYEDNTVEGAYVDYSGYLDAENGNPDTTTLVGAYSDSNSPLVSGHKHRSRCPVTP